MSQKSSSAVALAFIPCVLGTRTIQKDSSASAPVVEVVMSSSAARSEEEGGNGDGGDGKSYNQRRHLRPLRSLPGP